MPTATSNPTSALNSAVFGTQVWANTANVFSSNDTYATSVGDDDEFSRILLVTGFNFSEIPPGSEITSVKARIEIKRTTGGDTNAEDNIVQLLKAGLGFGNNKATLLSLPTSDTYKEYTWNNNAADGLDPPLILSDVKSSTFGCDLRVQFTDKDLTTVSVDHVEIQINYNTRNNKIMLLDSKIIVGNNKIYFPFP